MRNHRPMNLDLTTMHFPITAIVSILHRISGVLLFLYAPFLLWLWDRSLSSSTHFLSLQAVCYEPFMKWVIWLFLAALSYHLVAGIKHLLMDFKWGESLKSARMAAKFTLVFFSVLTLIAGVWLWW